jgi:hypothetical protein
MGAGPESTGITSGNYDFENPELPPVVYGKEYPYFPTIYSVMKDQRPGSIAGAVCHWSGFESLFEKSQADFHISPGTKEKTADSAIKYILEKKPFFTFIQFDNTDIAGHVYGYCSDSYKNAVHQTDSLAGKIISAMDKAGMLNESLIMICADHGGIGYSHGGTSEEEMTVPLILYGKGVKKNYQIEVPVSVIDYAPTVIFAMGLKQPYAWTGRAIKSAFLGNKTPDLVYKRENTAKMPIIYPDGKNYEPAGGFFIDSLPIVKMKNPNYAGHIRYTIDGTVPKFDSPEYIEPFRLNQTAIIKAAIFTDDSFRVSRCQTAYFRILKDKNGHGLKYNCYQKEFDNSVRTVIRPKDRFDLTKMKPVISGITYDLSSLVLPFPDLTGLLTMVTFDGWIEIKTSGGYTFTTRGASKLKFFVDELEVLPDGGDGHAERSGSVELDQGRHKIHIEWIIIPTPKSRKFFEYGPPLQKNNLILYYQGGKGVTRQLIPPDVLYLNFF